MSHHACRYGRPDGIVLAHFFFFFNDTATTEIYTLSLHDALPILVHPEVVADPAHDDGPRVDADPHLQTEAALGLELLRVIAERLLDSERRVDGAPRSVLVGDGRAEERHDAVARVLVDRALEPVDLRSDQLEAALDDAVHVLRIELLGERREPGDVGEENRHLAALALERRARLEDLIGQVLGRVRRERRPESAPRRSDLGRAR